jgi:hypothetical protein
VITAFQSLWLGATWAKAAALSITRVPVCRGLTLQLRLPLVAGVGLWVDATSTRAGACWTVHPYELRQEVSACGLQAYGPST